MAVKEPDLPHQHGGASAPARTDAPIAGLLWGVGAVARRVGVAGPTLRTWDRRYGLGPSARTQGGHRRYNEGDVARVELMSRLIDEGVPALEAATMVTGRDEAAVASLLDSGAPLQARRLAPASRRAAEVAIGAVISAAERLDGPGLSRTYAQTLDRHGVVDGWTDVLSPALVELGRRWHGGAVGVESEHLASERMATELRAFIKSRRVRRGDPLRVLLASAPDEEHAMPLLALEAALADRRVASLGFGARLPADALASAVNQMAPTVVVVWASMQRKKRDRTIAHWSVRPDQCHVLLGGPGWADVTVAKPDHVVVQRVPDLVSAVAVICNLIAA